MVVIYFDITRPVAKGGGMRVIAYRGLRSLTHFEQMGLKNVPRYYYFIKQEINSGHRCNSDQPRPHSTRAILTRVSKRFWQIDARKRGHLQLGQIALRIWTPENGNQSE